jgi:hypothetical protein
MLTVEFYGKRPELLNDTWCMSAGALFEPKPDDGDGPS